MENTMKTFSLRAAFALALIMAAAPSVAQGKPEIFNIPLSRPGEPISLDIGMKSAHITVIGEDRVDAEFEVSIEAGERVIVTPSGPQSLSNAGYAFEIDERDNQISVDTDWRNNKVVLVARIPKMADLEIGTIYDSVIIVNNVSGDLELSNVNGPITATGITGSVIAESVNDAIDLTFVSFDNAKASSLETVNGELSIRLPAGAGAEIHLDTSQGEIFSDFEVDVQSSKPTVERDEEHGGVEVRIESVIIANINGGGPIIRMISLNGDLNILKAK
jgi:hypothetical protein